MLKNIEILAFADPEPRKWKKNYGFPMGWWISRWESQNLTLKKPIKMGISHHVSSWMPIGYKQVLSIPFGNQKWQVKTIVLIVFFKHKWETRENNMHL